LNPTTATDARSFGRHLRLAATRPDDPQRQALETFVRDAFARKHSADVQSFMPTLLSFRDASASLCGVVGLRPAGESPLYLERYLDAPIERALADATGRTVRRGEIVEVGNLAGRNCRAAMRMVAQLPVYLMAQDFRWITFTATSTVRELLLSFGAPLVELARAEHARVAGGRDRWGTYYETDPRVFAGFLPDSRQLAGFAAAGRDH
jgi:Thermostable hemolysin